MINKLVKCITVVLLFIALSIVVLALPTVIIMDLKNVKVCADGE